ncbi:MAG: TlpA disulfide reductase family protein [Algibacter sp.]
MKILLSFGFVLLFFSCKNKVNETTLEIKKEVVAAQVNSPLDLEIYDFAGFKSFLEKRDNKIYVINFWATWCAPCVKELPYFEKLNKEYMNDNVEVILVSLDFPHVYESKLKPFITKNKLKSKVIALDDVDANSWIPKVDESWTGSIPATVIYRNEKSKFYEQSFTYEELEKEVKQFIN